MSSILDMHKLGVGTYLSSEQGPDAPVQKPSDVPHWNGPYLQGDKAPVDAWNPGAVHDPV
jgi:general secretion pathway protein G